MTPAAATHLVTPIVPSPRCADARAWPRDHIAPLQLELVTSRAGFDALRADWDALFERAGRGMQVFQTHAWNWHWSNHYLDGRRGGELSIVTARREDRLVLVWPLITERIAGLRRIAWMGAPVSQYGDVLLEAEADAGAVLRQSWRFLVDAVAPDLVWLPMVRADAAVAPLIAELPAHAIQRRQAPHVTREDDHPKARMTRNARARDRRLARFGPTGFEELAGTGKAHALAMRTVTMKRLQLKRRGILSAALADRHTVAFFGDAVAGLGHDTGARVYELTADGEPAASGIFIGCKDRLVSHIAAFDARFEKASAGILLLEQAIAQAFAAGYRTFDLLAPADAYKARWAQGSVEVVDWSVPISRKAEVFSRLYLAFARPALKASLAALPLALRRLVVAAYSG